MLAARFGLYVFWFNMLISFLVGMIKDVSLGLKIFGYGSAALTCLSIALPPLYVLLFHGKALLPGALTFGFITALDMRRIRGGGRPSRISQKTLDLMLKLRGDHRWRSRSRSRRRPI